LIERALVLRSRQEGAEYLIVSIGIHRDA
jgi:hypothetical protein